MTATVRVYTYVGTIAMPQSSNSGAYITNGQWMLKYPYLVGEVLTAGTGAAVTSAEATAPAAAKMVHIQIQPGSRCHFEITPGGQPLREATTDSPIMKEELVTLFGPEWRLSVLEAAADA